MARAEAKKRTPTRTTAKRAPTPAKAGMADMAKGQA
jgi:hypothetical protein